MNIRKIIGIVLMLPIIVVFVIGLIVLAYASIMESLPKMSPELIKAFAIDMILVISAIAGAAIYPWGK